MQEVSFAGGGRSTLAIRPPSTITPLLLFAILATPVVVGVAGYAGHWDATATGLAALLPLWALIFPIVYWMNRVYGAWLAFFAVVALPQLGHFGEHTAQMIQIHVQGAAPPAAHGAVGQLDIEWVHFLWNLWVLIGAGILMMHYRRNPWLWATAVIGAWHLAEHVAIMIAYWNTGKPGDPGLLAKGGDIGGGLNIIRPDLHFIYNLAMTVPLMAAFIWQLRRTGDEESARATSR
ncbi:MAG: hypothetical protein ACJ768_25885 [Gaiellaceae bacterium]